MSESPDRGPVPDRSEPAGPSRWQHFVGGWGAWRWGSLLLLSPGFALFLLFVRQDEPALSTGPALLIDNLLRVASLSALAGLVVLLIAREDIARRASAVASIAVLLLGGAVVLSGLWSPRRDLLVVALALLATVLAACNVWVQRRVGPRWRFTSTKGLAAVLTVAAVPAFTFWAETSYLPSRNSVTVLGSVEVEPQLAPDMSLHLVVSSTVENSSDVQARLLMSELTVCSSVDEADPGNCTTVAAPFDQATWIDPGARSTVDRAVAVDPERPLVHARLRWWYARADRLVLEPPEEVTGRALGDCAWAERRDIRAPSRLSSLALQDLSLVYAHVEDDGYLTYSIHPTDDLVCDQPDLSEALQPHLALTWDTTVWMGWPTAPATVDRAG